jgi:hypothetical protein
MFYKTCVMEGSEDVNSVLLAGCYYLFLYCLVYGADVISGLSAPKYICCSPLHGTQKASPYEEVPGTYLAERFATYPY